MSIVAIDPNTVRAQSNEKRQSALPGVGFSDVLNATNAPISTAVALDQGYQPAAVTSAAISGIAQAPGSFGPANAPYYGVGAQAISLPPGGYPLGDVPIGGGPSGSLGIAGAGVPSQDYLEKQALFQEMNDANWEMLLAQVTVNEISRDWQARSNILKTKSDAELNAVRNFRS